MFALDRAAYHARACDGAELTGCRTVTTMAAEKVSRAPLIDVFDRVLDKGIVFDASVRMSAAGIDLIAVETDVIVASIDTDTYLNSVAMSRLVFIVAVDRPALFETMRVVNSVSWTNVVLDRRRGERRGRSQGVAEDRRHAERRTHDVDRELKSVGMAAVVLPQAPVTSIAGKPVMSIPAPWRHRVRNGRALRWLP